jgi:hypothetical protein
MTKHLIGTVILLSLLTTEGWGQPVRTMLEFQQDSLRLGQTIELRLLVERPPGTQVILPNQSRYFVPFEMLTYEVEPTRTVNGKEWDAVQYRLRSFEVKEYQTLSLEVGYLQNRDTVFQTVESDTIFLSGLVSGELEQLDYLVYEDLVPLTDPPNYRMAILLGVALLIVVAALFLVLRKPVRRYLAMRSLQMEWQQVRRKLKKLEQLQDQSVFFPAINTLWKSYMDPDEKMALRSMTTTELRAEITRISYLNAEQQKSLIQIAQAGDAVIYAGESDSGMDPSQVILTLRKILRQNFEQKKLALKRAVGSRSA